MSSEVNDRNSPCEYARELAVVLCVLGGLSLFGQAVPGQATQRSTPFANVEILRGTSPEQMTLIMQSASTSLGVECEYCHEAGAWHLDEKAPKRTARTMMRMIATLSATDFAALEVPSCWTCHRGRATPAVEPESSEAEAGQAVPVPVGAFSSDPRPSGQVYSNIRLFTDLPANELRGVMTAYSRWLGVNCSHCHVVGDWASDEKLMKLVARRMFEIEARMENDFFAADEILSCWTCHRGEATPQTRLPPERMPSG